MVSGCEPRSPSWCACLRSAASPVNKLPLSPALLPMTMTAVCGAARDTSKVGVSEAKPLRCRIAGCLLLEPPTESLLQAPSRSRKAAYACSGRMCPQAPHLRQHRSRPRHLLEVLRSHYVMVAQHEAISGCRRDADVDAVVAHPHVDRPQAIFRVAAVAAGFDVEFPPVPGADDVALLGETQAAAGLVRRQLFLDARDHLALTDRT